MDELSNRQQAVELLQQLGLKEYEARCFVALTRLPKGTAKEISENSDVPRTRVYDAIRVLESKGLVEVQHSSPKQFRSVPVGEAAETLRQEYESRTETLVDLIETIAPASGDDDREVTHEVWALSGSPSIANRTRQLVEGAGREVIFVAGRGDVVTEELLEELHAARDAGLTVIVGASTEEMQGALQDALPDTDVFVSGLEWLASSPIDPADETTISRLLLVDRNTILVSSVNETGGDGLETEKAVFGRGFDNGLVVIARRLMATGLSPADDPDVSAG
ncbi:TrmB family transcriptional regulator [Natronobeatus ordinarius]|uniref:TrmB family transcriptional regulator n=1 Tax=Natronobeatus ordinarius TaxID=2963433 RepID=UPI0020CBED6B|nr:helix-turn-helix domain-containing protein [Natronobeatus ordinarius]